MFASAIFAVVTAFAAIAGEVAVPLRSPANWIFPVASVVASATAKVLLSNQLTIPVPSVVNTLSLPPDAIFAVVTFASRILAVVTASAASFAAVMFASAIFAVVTAFAAIAGEVAVPLRSPANWIFPVASVVASDAAAPVTAVVTNAVVATWVVFVPLVAVGAVGTPVNAGLANGAFRSNAVWVAPDTGLFASEVLSTLPKPTSVLLKERSVLAAVAVNTSGTPDPAVLLPNKDAVAIFSSLPKVTFASASLAVVTAPAAIAGEAAVPARSPANWIFPLVIASASTTPAAAAAST